MGSARSARYRPSGLIPLSPEIHCGSSRNTIPIPSTELPVAPSLLTISIAITEQLGRAVDVLQLFACVLALPDDRGGGKDEGKVLSPVQRLCVCSRASLSGWSSSE